MTSPRAYVLGMPGMIAPDAAIFTPHPDPPKELIAALMDSGETISLSLYTRKKRILELYRKDFLIG